jgi:hypothetical protein
MTITQRLRCAFGRHSGPWSLPGRDCERTRTCDTCGRRQEQTRHTWSPYEYVENGRCEQVRRCQRCGTSQERAGHDWGPWLYANNEMNSPQVRTCLRCHRSERTSPTYR